MLTLEKAAEQAGTQKERLEQFRMAENRQRKLNSNDRNAKLRTKAQSLEFTWNGMKPKKSRSYKR